MIMSQNWFGQFTVAGWAGAFLSGVCMDRESWRVDPEFNELVGLYMSLDNIRWNLEICRDSQSA
jgi:hypothetical protein